MPRTPSRAARRLLRRVPPLHRAAKAVHQRLWWRRVRSGAATVGPIHIQVDPAALERTLETAALRRLTADRSLRDLIGAVRSGDWDRSLPVDDQELLLAATTRRLRDGAPWEDTPFYAEVVAAIGRGERRFGAATLAELPGELAALDDLAAAIRDDGYRSQVELGTGRDWDEVMVAIDRRGRLLFVNGAHRLAVARALALPTIPAVVTVRHADWAAFTAEIRGYLAGKGRSSYQPIAHPDLSDVSSAHGTERLAMVVPHLPPAPASILDIGANWGWFSIELARRGYACTGVEQSEVNVHIARGLARAMGVDVDLVRSSIFEAPLGTYDAVLALNIFHHFLKREDTMAALADLLGRLRTPLLIFQPHTAADRGMDGAHWNPSPEAFAAWVAERAGMEVDRRIGEAADGRPIYVLRRTP